MKNEQARQNELDRARLAAIVQSCPDPIIGETLDGIITDWNPAAERVYGYRAGEAVGQSIVLISPPDRFDEVRYLLSQVQQGTSVEALETVRRARDGRLIDVSLTVFPIRDEQGAVIGASATTRDISGRKAAEAALVEARQRAQHVLELISDGFLTLDRAWRITYLNAAAESMLKCKRQVVVQSSIWKALELEEASPFAAACRQAMAGGATTRIEFFHAPGERWLEARIDPHADGLAIVLQDVTDAHTLSQELHASEAKYRALVEHLPAAVYLLAADENETPLYYSPYIEQLVGVSADEVIRAREEHWLNFLHPDDVERVAAANELAMAERGHFRAEYRTMREDGSFIWVLDECVPLLDASGAVLAWQGILMDITDRIEAEAVRARLAAIVDGAEDAIFSRTLDGTITSWNEGAERLFGWTAQEMIGQSYAKLIPGGETIALDALLQEIGQGPARFETTRRTATRDLIDVAVSLSPIRDQDGRMQGVASITRDITERKRAEVALHEALEAAQAATRSKAKMLATMSHELRTPLQAVLGYAEFLLNGLGGELSELQREDIGYIHGGATRMVTLIEQMLDLSRIEVGKVTLATEDVDLRQIIEQVRQDIAPLAEVKGLKVTVDVCPDLPILPLDAMRVRQILLNLAGNAVKFTEQGTITLGAVAAADGGADLSVYDTGIGIAERDLETIFQEFRQIDGEATRRHGGAGLGLGIARGLAELMGGAITVISALGAGSTFTLHLRGGEGGEGG